MQLKAILGFIFVALLAAGSSFGQSGEIRVSGTVTDAKGAEIPGANVSLAGTTSGVITDAQGKFALSVPNSQSVLRISFIGYKTAEAPDGAKAPWVCRNIPARRLGGARSGR